MADRDGDYVVLRNRKAKKSRQYYYDDEDDDDDDSQIYRRMARRRGRNRYFSSDDIESDYRQQQQPSDPRIRIRKTTNGDRVILDEDDNVIKVIRDGRSPSPIPFDRRRLRHRPRESQSMFYEGPDGHIASRPWKRNTIHTKKTQVVYADDEPTKMIKRVIIDPRTGERETIYDKDKPKRQQKYYLRQHPAQVFYDSDESDDQQPTPYARTVKYRNVPNEILPRREPPPSTRYVMIKKRSESDPLYGVTSRAPVIRNNRRIVYEAPPKKPITTYIYPNGKYYK